MTRLPGALRGARIVGERFLRSRRQQSPDGRMSLIDHLRELRNRVVKMALGLVAGMIAGFVFFTPVWNVIQRPLCSTAIRGHVGCQTLGVNQLVLDGPLDSFYLRVKVAAIVGVILSSPIWLYQIWAFVAPGLYAREKRWSLPCCGRGSRGLKMVDFDDGNMGYYPRRGPLGHPGEPPARWYGEHRRGDPARAGHRLLGAGAAEAGPGR